MIKNIYIDTETTGLDPVMNDIIELGAIIEIDGVKVAEFQGNCQPVNFNKVSHHALKVNKTTIEELKTYDTPKQMLINFVKFLGKHHTPKDNSKYVIHGQNTPFDVRFLKKFFHKMGYDSYAFHKIFDYHTADLLELTALLRQKGIIPAKSNLKLETMAKFFGVVQENAHTALDDIRVTYEIYKCIKTHLIKSADKIDLTVFAEDTPIHEHLKNLIKP
jgi:DNA polymerase III alpha subunit (gram-positive type)